MDVKAEQTVEESSSTAFLSTALLSFVIVFGFRARLSFDIAQGGELVEPRPQVTIIACLGSGPTVLTPPLSLITWIALWLIYSSAVDL